MGLGLDLELDLEDSFDEFEVREAELALTSTPLNPTPKQVREADLPLRPPLPLPLTPTPNQVREADLTPLTPLPPYPHPYRYPYPYPYP